MSKVNRKANGNVLISAPLVLIFVSALFISYTNMKENKPKDVAKACVATYITDQSGALSSQFDSALTDEIKLVKAGAFKKKFKPLKSVEKYVVDGKSVIWADNDAKQIIVDKNYFSDLKITDVTKVALDGSAVVGKVDIGFFIKWTPRQIVSFLIDSQLLETYWHIGADICLTEEQDFGSHYIAHFKGRHTYFTNEKNVEDYTFGVQVDKVTGTVAIFGK